ncbi:MAG: hypothetical protein IH587_09085, partial [Anaerolineae bacterium]|nr:hypothetical protein [Anaerolineae bacterium]
VPFGIGIIFPSLFYWATNLIRETAYWSKGLTPDELERTERFFLHAELEMSHIMRSGTVRRVWFPKTDRVFISHAWEDAEPYQDAAQLLANICTLYDTPCFFDRRNIAEKFAAWRLKIVPHLLRCTHFSIVIGPDILKGDVVLRELKTAIQRWGTEVYPAIVCVVDHDVVEALLANEDLPHDLRFVLTQCPQLSLEDASHDEIVECVIEQRRFQGMLEDWRTLFNPRATYERFLNSIRENDHLFA